MTSRSLILLTLALCTGAPVRADEAPMWRAAGDAEISFKWTFSQTTATKTKKKEKRRRDRQGKKVPKLRPWQELLELEAVLRPAGGKAITGGGTFEVALTRYTWKSTGSRGYGTTVVFDGAKSKEATVTSTYPKHMAVQPTKRNLAIQEAPKFRYRLVVSRTEAKFEAEREGKWWSDHPNRPSVFNGIVLHPKLPATIQDGAKFKAVYEREGLGRGAELPFVLKYTKTPEGELLGVSGSCKTTSKEKDKVTKASVQVRFKRSFEFSGGLLASSSSSTIATRSEPRARVTKTTVSRKQDVQATLSGSK
jgi:hypothetical protein